VANNKRLTTANYVYQLLSHTLNISSSFLQHFAILLYIVLIQLFAAITNKPLLLFIIIYYKFIQDTVCQSFSELAEACRRYDKNILAIFCFCDTVYYRVTRNRW